MFRGAKQIHNRWTTYAKAHGFCAFLLLTGCENRTLKADKIKILDAEINMHQRKIDELKGTATGDGTVLKKADALKKLKRDAQEKLDGLVSNK